MKKIITLLLVASLILTMPYGLNTSYATALDNDDENAQTIVEDSEENSALEFDDSKSQKNKEGVSPLVEKAREGYKRGFHISRKAPSTVEGLTPLYRANTNKNVSLRSQTDENEADKLESIPEGGEVTIYEVGPNWVLADYKGHVGWIKRFNLQEGSIVAIDPKNTEPYGVFKPKYVATLTDDAFIYNQPSVDAVPFKIPVEKGAKFAILGFENGFAKIIVWRDYGYVDASLLTDVQMVAPADEPLADGMPIAAFHSIFDHNIGIESNDARVVNIAVSCKYMDTTLAPGEEFDFNAQVGPYRRTKGYMAAPVLIDGGTQLGYGGGTCQSSSTLYNALMQLPRVSILYRRPHGPGSAKYLPQHQDAAVGSKALNFKFRNDYAFPIKIEAKSVNGCLFIAVYKATDDKASVSAMK